jgi:phosphopantothenoylcysteine decarboxylase/phosphopantothenate--cysteine ligase
MWSQPAVQANVATLVERGASLVGPVAGALACGEEGVGAMAPLDDIVGAIGG